MKKEHPEEKEPAFKVVDRRRFTEEGQEKDGGELQEQEDERAQASRAKKTDDAYASAHDPRPAMSFSLFVQSLAHQAMMGLGIVPWPDSGLVRTELDLTREMIDILKILKDKSTGNLTKDEQHLLDGLLYQLQVAFVEISKKPSGDTSPIIK